MSHDARLYDRRRRRRGRHGSLLGMIIVLLAIVLAGLSLKSYVHERGNARGANTDIASHI
jgi:hypothetical protein